MLKQLFDPTDQCGAQNPLITLSKNIGQANSKIASDIQQTVQAELPTNEAATLLAQEYLGEVAQRMPALNTFDMRKIVEQLPMEAEPKLSGSEETMMEQIWEKEKHKSLAIEWSEQFLPNCRHKWVEEFEQRNHHGKAEREEKAAILSTWAKDYLDHFDSSSVSLANDGQVVANAEAAMVDEWEREFMARQMSGEMSFFDYESAWEAIHSKEAQEQYQFSQQNPFAGEQNAKAKAEETFQKGRVADSILHYEAALQREPLNVELWHSLGIALAENEDDPRAISALRNALKLDPSHKPTLLSLSVSLANESFDHLALHELHKWICVHTKKEMPHDNADNNSLYRQYAQLDGTEFTKVEQHFLSAVGVDQSCDQAELQNALSVLYNLARDYDRAVDCVRAALAFRSEDPVLWNRLGATLANADRTAEAINAYKMALHLFPSYVRARYNLGIACTNLNSYRDAATHFVTALQLQNSPENSQIWSKLRSAMIRLTGDDEPSADCFAALERRELDKMVAFLRRKNI